MSTATRRRKLERERIHARNLALAQRLAEERRPRWFGDGVREGARQERERRKILLEPCEDEYLLSAPPEHDVKFVALVPSMKLASGFDDYTRHHARYLDRPQMVAFRAVKKSWRAGTGQVVTWWDWELKG